MGKLYDVDEPVLPPKPPSTTVVEEEQESIFDQPIDRESVQFPTEPVDFDVNQPIDRDAVRFPEGVPLTDFMPVADQPIDRESVQFPTEPVDFDVNQPIDRDAVRFPEGTSLNEWLPNKPVLPPEGSVDMGRGVWETPDGGTWVDPNYGKAFEIVNADEALVRIQKVSPNTDSYDPVALIQSGQVTISDIAAVFGKDVAVQARTQLEALAILEKYKAKDGTYNIAAALLDGIPEEVFVTANFEIDDIKPILEEWQDRVPNWQEFIVIYGPMFGKGEASTLLNSLNPADWEKALNLSKEKLDKDVLFDEYVKRYGYGTFITKAWQSAGNLVIEAVPGVWLRNAKDMSAGEIAANVALDLLVLLPVMSIGINTTLKGVSSTYRASVGLADTMKAEKALVKQQVGVMREVAGEKAAYRLQTVYQANKQFAEAVLARQLNPASKVALANETRALDKLNKAISSYNQALEPKIKKPNPMAAGDNPFYPKVRTQTKIQPVTQKQLTARSIRGSVNQLPENTRSMIADLLTTSKGNYQLAKSLEKDLRKAQYELEQLHRNRASLQEIWVAQSKVEKITVKYYQSLGYRLRPSSVNLAKSGGDWAIRQAAQARNINRQMPDIGSKPRQSTDQLSQLAVTQQLYKPSGIKRTIVGGKERVEYVMGKGYEYDYRKMPELKQFKEGMRNIGAETRKPPRETVESGGTSRPFVEDAPRPTRGGGVGIKTKAPPVTGSQRSVELTKPTTARDIDAVGQRGAFAGRQIKGGQLPGISPMPVISPMTPGTPSPARPQSPSKVGVSGTGASQGTGSSQATGTGTGIETLPSTAPATDTMTDTDIVTITETAIGLDTGGGASTFIDNRPSYVPPKEGTRVPPPAPRPPLGKVPVRLKPKLGDDDKLASYVEPEGTIAWQQGFVGDDPIWYVARYPYESQDDLTIFVGVLPKGVNPVEGGEGGALRSLQLITGKPPEQLRIDMGIQDITIRGKSMEFANDRYQNTRGDITVKKGRIKVVRRETLDKYI